MDITLFREDDGSFGAKITIENEIIFAQGDTMEDLRTDVRQGLSCVFDEDQKNYITTIQQPLEPMLQFFIHHTPSHATHV